MPDYSLGKIYRLYVVGNEGMPYIGSTCDSLNKRVSVHRNQAGSLTQTKTASCIMFAEGNEVRIELIEDFACATKLELETRERYWLEQNPNAVNKNTPTRTWKERWEKNKEHNVAVHKAYLAAHKDEIAAHRATPEVRARENAAAKARLADPEKLKAHKEVRDGNKKERVKCPDCDKEMNKNSLWEHKKKIHAPANLQTPP